MVPKIVIGGKMFKLLISLLLFSVIMGSCSFFDAEESPEFDPQSLVGTYQFVTEESSTYPDSGLLEVELVATTHRDVTLGEYTYTQNVHEYKYTERTSDDVIKKKIFGRSSPLRKWTGTSEHVYKKAGKHSGSSRYLNWSGKVWDFSR